MSRSTTSEDAVQTINLSLLRARDIRASLECLVLEILERYEPVCRFCGGADRTDLMLSTCNCKEPHHRWAHATCLETYVTMYNAVTCTVCSRRFPVRKVPAVL
ncbi:uncharacterized protein LOC135393029 isoform X3 [Ornithodoros turicata]|uniref:uncharacterized protein LOC135393029 isoform X3 n=1 Tax=Ornithodoros turicata TaxID=34597 RepID=UPI003138CC23